MDFESWEKRWNTTLLTAVVLRRLSGQKSFGRDIVEHSQNILSSDIKIPTVYAMLKRLSAQGYVQELEESGKAPQTRGTRRKYYSLTLSGEEYLRKVSRVLRRSEKIIEMVIGNEDTE